MISYQVHLISNTWLVLALLIPMEVIKVYFSVSWKHFPSCACECTCRRNAPGDREQALRVMLQVLQSCEHPAPDMFCLCGRIYKDIFLDSDCKDTKNRDNAIQWWEHTEINASYSHLIVSLCVFICISSSTCQVQKGLWAAAHSVLGY